MTWWEILLLLAALLVVVFLLPIRLRLYTAPKLTLTARLLFFNIVLFPRPKQPNVKKFTVKYLAKQAKKLKNKKQTHKKARSPGKKAQNNPSLVSLRPGELRTLLPTLLAVIRSLLQKLNRYLRIHTANMELTIASDDAATTAVLYGFAAGMLDALCGLLEQIGTTRRADRKNIKLFCDFCATQPTFSCNFVFTLRVWQICSTALGAGMAFVRQKTQNDTDNTNTTSGEKNAQQREKREKQARDNLVWELTS